MDYPTHRSRILIVDDEAEILVALSDLLEGEFDIVSTTKPCEALDLIRTNADIAVIVSDQRMPGMTGDLLLSQAQKVSNAKGILLTGYADLTAVISALNRGRIQFYVHKPWDSEALKAMVRESAHRFHIENALQTERFLLQSTLQAATFEVVFSDAEGRVLRHNRGRHAQTSVQDEPAPLESESRPDIEEALLYPETERAAVVSRRHKVVSEAVVEETVQVERDGEIRWIDQTRVLLPWPRAADGSLRPPSERWHVTFANDVTEKRAMAQRLRQDDKMRALGTLSGGIAHDFNNLLTAILGSLDLLEELLPSDMLEGEQLARKLIDNAVSSARKGASLTRGLLEFGRPKRVSLTPVNLVQLITNLKELMSQSLVSTTDAADDKGRCVLDLSAIEHLPHTIFVASDAEQLEMAFINLCINARDAMRDGGRVCFEISDEKGPDGQAWVGVTVKDTGHGMSAEVAARVFDPFFTTKKIGEGTGLGLSTIYRFLTRTGGDIRVESEVGFGTSITLLLPNAPTQIASYAPIQDEHFSKADALNILLVDDESHVRLVTERLLSRKGHRVSSFPDGESAVTHLRNGAKCDLAVLDLMMPGMTGVTCGQNLEEIMPSLKILYISGYSDPIDVPAGSTVLGKPYSTAQLCEAINALMK